MFWLRLHFKKSVLYFYLKPHRKAVQIKEQIYVYICALHAIMKRSYLDHVLKNQIQATSVCCANTAFVSNSSLFHMYPDIGVTVWDIVTLKIGQNYNIVNQPFCQTFSLIKIRHYTTKQITTVCTIWEKKCKISTLCFNTPQLFYVIVN